MIAGGETAMVMHSIQLAKRGHEVFLFYSVDRPIRYKGVDFLPKSAEAAMITTLKGDVLISWEDLQTPSYNHTCDLTILSFQNNAMIIKTTDYAVDYYQCVSNWHRDTLIASDASLRPSSASKFVVWPNGVDLARYQSRPARIPYRIIHSSSPDRGLHHLLRLWPNIKKAIPQAELHIFYELQRWFDLVDHAPNVITADRAKRVREGLAKNEGNGVIVHGAVNQWQLAQEQMKASLMVYTCQPIAPTEGYSISVMECLAAGTPVVTTDADAFPELWTDHVRMMPLPIEDKEDSWVRAIEYTLTNKEEWTRLSRNGMKHAKTLTWDKIGKDYEKWLGGELAKKRGQRGD